MQYACSIIESVMGGAGNCGEAPLPPPPFKKRHFMLTKVSLADPDPYKSKSSNLQFLQHTVPVIFKMLHK